MLKIYKDILTDRIGWTRFERRSAIARFLLPGAFLLGGAMLRDYPLSGTSCATAFACLAIGAELVTDHEVALLSTGTGLLLSIAPLSLYRSWNSSPPLSWGYLTNGLVASAWLAIYPYLLTEQVAREQEVAARQLPNISFIAICCAIQKAAPLSLATVGIGAAIWAALFLSHKREDEIDLQSIAYGTGCALLPTAMVGAWTSLNWSDQLLYSGGALLNLSSLLLAPWIIYKEAHSL